MIELFNCIYNFIFTYTLIPSINYVPLENAGYNNKHPCDTFLYPSF